MPWVNRSHAFSRSPNETRQRLTRFVFAENIANCPIGRLEDAFLNVLSAEPLEKIISQAVKTGLVQSHTRLEQLDEACLKGLIREDEKAQLISVDSARRAVIAVDDFSHDELSRVKIGEVYAKSSDDRSRRSRTASA
jgi:acyl-CoA dehydrogenase